MYRLSYTFCLQLKPPSGWGAQSEGRKSGRSNSEDVQVTKGGGNWEDWQQHLNRIVDLHRKSGYERQSGYESKSGLDRLSENEALESFRMSFGKRLSLNKTIKSGEDPKMGGTEYNRSQGVRTMYCE